jgi:CO/xanthine dehydrogenase FAD-binding subunit
MTAPRVHAPRSLDAALALLAEREPHRRVIAGGTDLMVALHAGSVQADILVDLWKVDELRGIHSDGQTLRVGALATYTDLMRSALCRERLPALAEAAATVGAVQIQNRGTIGGNLVNASPAADLAPLCSALDAELELRSRTRMRRVSIHAFFTGYRATCLEPDELLTAIHLLLPAADESVRFRKVGTRRAQSISKVVLALAVRSAGGRITSLRAAAGSVAPTVVRLASTEGALRGEALPLGEPARARVRALVAADISPIDDVRSTAAYRRAVCGNVLWRLLAHP